MKNKMFRKAALEKLSTPEQLDQLMQVTTPKGWVALLAMFAIIATLVLWSIYGRIPLKVQARGILIRSGGVFDIVSPSSGQLAYLKIKTGDLVKKGQLIARIAQPQLLEKIHVAQNDFNDKKEKYITAKKRGERPLTVLQLEAVKKQRQSTIESIKTTKKAISWLDEKIKSQEKLLTAGLITKQKLITSKEERDKNKENILSLKATLENLAAKETQLKKGNSDYIEDKQNTLKDARIKLEELTEELEHSSKVSSSYTGNVIEITVDKGDLINPGTTIARLELSGNNAMVLEALLYVSALEGKKVREGMDVQISPSVVKKEEYGFILGKVTRVAEFPATNEGMMRHLSNSALVASLTSSVPVLEVSAALVPSSSTVTGYRWSSKKGPPNRIGPGTMCTAGIVTRHQVPITMVIPYIKKKLGID